MRSIDYTANGAVMSFALRIIFGVLLIISMAYGQEDGVRNPVNPPTEPPIAYDYCSDWSPNGTRIIFNRLNNVVTGIRGGLFFYNFKDNSLTHFSDGQFFDNPRFHPTSIGWFLELGGIYTESRSTAATFSS